MAPKFTNTTTLPGWFQQPFLQRILERAGWHVCKGRVSPPLAAMRKGMFQPQEERILEMFSSHFSPKRGGQTSLKGELGRRKWVGGWGIPFLPTSRSASPQRVCVLLSSCVPHLGGRDSPPLLSVSRHSGADSNCPGSWWGQGLLCCFLEQGAPRLRLGEGVSPVQLCQIF